jgi:tetratricopeptide (TPR) repeat protein
MSRSLLLALLACAPLLAQRSEVEQAWDLAGKGRRDDAIRLLQQAVAKDAANADAYLLLGSLLSEAGDAPDAIAQLTKGVGLKPGSAEAQNALGEAYLAAGDYKGARQPFETAVRLDPGFGVAQLNLGSVLLQSSEYGVAGKHLDSAIQLIGRDPDAPYACYLRAKAYSAEGDAKNAARLLEQAVALRPAYAEAWSDLGQARKLLLDQEGSLAAQKHAVELNPSDAVAQYRLGAEYLRGEQPGPALVHLQAAYRLRPDDQSTLNSLQGALRQAGRAEEANEIRRKLSELLREKDHQNQNQLKAVKLNNQGAELQKAGNVEGALAKYREAAALFPSHDGIRVNYAVALLRLGRWAEGLTELHEALLRDPGNAQLRSAFADAIRQAPSGTVPSSLRPPSFKP